MKIELGPLGPKPSEQILGLILLFTMMAFLGLRLLPRIERLRAERWDATEGRVERAEELLAEAESVRQARLEELVAARHEAARIRQDYAEQGAASIAAARAEALRDREALLAATHAALDADRVQANARLREDVGELAVTLAGRVVGEPVHAVAIERRTVDRFFADR
ncbi:hypothetical protein [Streptomyces sp. NRRL WC-3742]|uniref:F0F1 ATP synthase subunit B family protein n=1 Tax=Streptomyces sp. NRRL WC-3742 TaxID=1463934 RepID=UPI0004CAE9D2|nr:hypothetical protein [Streptomyces sp. NRRL WC-3742]